MKTRVEVELDKLLDLTGPLASANLAAIIAEPSGALVVKQFK